MRNKRQRNKRRTKYQIGESESKKLKAITRAVRDAPTRFARIQLLKVAANGHHRQRLLPSRLKTARNAWNRHKQQQRGQFGACVCCTRESTHQHHVIPLSYGGNPVASENRVWICHDCHVEIHPFMETPEHQEAQEQDYQESKPLWA